MTSDGSSGTRLRIRCVAPGHPCVPPWAHTIGRTGGELLVIGVGPDLASPLLRELAGRDDLPPGTVTTADVRTSGWVVVVVGAATGTTGRACAASRISPSEP